MDIEDFKANGLINSGARAALFKIVITDWPGSTPETTRTIEYLAKGSQIPPSVFGQVEVPYMGRSIKVFGDRTYPNWNVTLYNTTDFALRTALETWHQSMNQHVENITTGDVTPAQTSYKRNAIVTQLGKDGVELKNYTMKGIFPVSIDAITVDWEMGNQIEMYDVEFAIDYWLPGSEDGTSEASNFPEGARNIAIG